MGRKSKTIIKESVSELRKLLSKQTKSKNMDRIHVLIYIKQERFATREILSEHINVTRRTIERWLSAYREGGIITMLLPEKRKRKSYLITEEIDKALGKRVMDSEAGFSSYVEAQKWIASEYNLNLKYNTIREHLIRHYKTKIKSPRKSHVKKDIAATEVFLKTS